MQAPGPMHWTLLAADEGHTKVGCNCSNQRWLHHRHCHHCQLHFLHQWIALSMQSRYWMPNQKETQCMERKQAARVNWPLQVPGAHAAGSSSNSSRGWSWDVASRNHEYCLSNVGRLLQAQEKAQELDMLNSQLFQIQYTTEVANQPVVSVNGSPLCMEILFILGKCAWK